MFHLVAFSAAESSVNLGGLVTPVVDATVTISGNNLLIPDKVTQIFGAASFAQASSTQTTAQLQSPSLREVFYPNLTPSLLATTFSGIPHINETFDNPIKLETNEGLNYYDDAYIAAPTTHHGCIVLLSDGPRQPIKNTNIYTLRATAALTQVAGTWVSGAMTFGQTLPVGNYDVVGMRVEATGLIAARLVFVGSSAVVRPGCPGLSGLTIMDFVEFRMGRIGTWGSFFSLTPPQLEVLGATGTAQVIYLDLIPR